MIGSFYFDFPFMALVHCISQFGNDFRPDYKFLGTLKTMFPEIPLLGVTATATTKVIVDVQKMLNLQQPIVFKAEFNRPNLYYHVNFVLNRKCFSTIISNHFDIRVLVVF